ncbi:MAG TPA: YihY/virulence factor BrkB family protein [Gemmatimonadales bacterium]|nr:YihY/virulence factor BrkB family protein [Gemmatimonadales bacterium]
MPFLASALTFDALLAGVPLIVLLLVGLTHFLHLTPQDTEHDISRILDRFLPRSGDISASDPIVRIKTLLVEITRRRTTLSLYATPLFLWFSTRLFASVRTALNEVFRAAPAQRQRHFLVSWTLAKGRDAIMVVATLTLFAVNTALTASIGVLSARGEALGTSVPTLGFLLTSVGRWLTEALGFAFALGIFFLAYRFASTRTMRWRAALVAAGFTAFAFEALKRLFALYLAHIATLDRISADANVGAIFLFLLWVYYTALVFLYGGVVADTWVGGQRFRERD